MQAREWLMLGLLIGGALVIAGVVTLWSIKQLAYKPKKQAPPKPVAEPCESEDASGRCRH
ncbi:MAG: hypothetical protein ACKOCK_08170 [Chloroflexota bacterium]